MNRLFVNVKVDREERPDVDAVYMQAVQALTGRGGWPMSVWLHARRPPVLRRHVLPERGPARHAVVHAACARSWPRRGASSATTSRSRRPSSPRRIDEHGAARRRADAELDADDPRRPRSRACARSSIRAWGGFGRAPKFPQAMTHRLPVPRARAQPARPRRAR